MKRTRAVESVGNECIVIDVSDENEVQQQQRVHKKVRLDEEETQTVSLEDEGSQVLSDTQQMALDAVISGKNVYITGNAGTGKSFLIERIKENLASRGLVFYVTAATGVAAYNIGGMTFHSYGGIGLGKNDLAQSIKYMSRDRKDRWKKTDVIIVDEVSMIGALYFEKLSEVAKSVRGRSYAPFGGIQMILVGDMLQLGTIPENKAGSQKMLSNTSAGTMQTTTREPYLFETATWKALKPTLIKLDFNFRQQNDRAFKVLLNAIRIGSVGKEHDEVLRSRDIGINTSLKVPDGVTKLFSYRADVLRVNNAALGMIKEVSHFYDADIYVCPALEAKNATTNANGTTTKSTEYPVDARIELKVGASVLLCCNLDMEEGLFNGSRGVVVKFIEENEDSSSGGSGGSGSDGDDDDASPQKQQPPKQPQHKVYYPLVRFDNGQRRIIRPHTWSQTEHKVLLSSFTQLPLILSYSATIHRCQGLTLNAALVDAKTFAYGQLYVAVSRVRCLQDLYLTNTGARQSKLADDNVVAFYRQNRLL